jgi:phosphoribosyl-ATP pyrophosphohydrolase
VTLDELRDLIAERARTRPAGSTTTALLDGGVHAVGKKVVEEAAELWMAAEHEDADRTAEEAAQLLYHVLVLLEARGVPLEEVYARM